MNHKNWSDKTKPSFPDCKQTNQITLSEHLNKSGTTTIQTADAVTMKEKQLNISYLSAPKLGELWMKLLPWWHPTVQNCLCSKTEGLHKMPRCQHLFAHMHHRDPPPPPPPPHAPVCYLFILHQPKASTCLGWMVRVVGKLCLVPSQCYDSLSVCYWMKYM